MLETVLNKVFVAVSQDDIELEKKLELTEYIYTNLLKHVHIYSIDDSDKIITVLKKLNYNLDEFNRLAKVSYWIRNAVVKPGKFKTMPSIDYILTTYDIFEALNMDLDTYDTYYKPSNVALSKCAYSIIRDNGLINNEADFIEVCKNIVENYYINEDRNAAVGKVLNILNRINKGFRELEEKYTGVVTSEEFYSLFEVTDKICTIYLSDIIKEFYPQYKNKLFVYIKQIVNASEKEIQLEDLVKHLRNIEELRLTFIEQKKEIKENLEKIDANVKTDVEKAFISLLDTLKNNKSIDEELKKKVIDNINYTFKNYKQKQDEFLEDKLNTFFYNCLDYINSLTDKSDLSKQMNIFISNFLDSSKDFFIEYDSKNFKSIASYLIENANVESEDLDGIIIYCKDLFKSGDINKIKSIHESLLKFKNFVNDKFKKEVVEDNLFSLIIKNNPELISKENNIEEIMGILSGKIPFKMYGYSGEEVRINKDFLSYEFYKMIVDDGYSMLFDGGLKKMNANLNYVFEMCKTCDINMKYLEFNEEMLYLLLNSDLYRHGGKGLTTLKEVFDADMIKFLLQENPSLLMMRENDIGIIVKRCVLNTNSTYNFYDLFLSELYGYKPGDFRDTKKALLKPFKYYDLGIDTKSIHFDIEEILASDMTVKLNSADLLNQYEKREDKKARFNALVNDFISESEEDVSYASIKNIIAGYMDLYSLVPDVEIKNSLFMFIDTKKDDYEQRLVDLEESVLEKNQVLETYKNEMIDGEEINKELQELLSRLTSDSAKKDIEEMLKRNKTRRIVDSKKRIDDTKKSLSLISSEIGKLETELKKLDQNINQITLLEDDEVYEKYVKKNSFMLTDNVGVSDDNLEIELESNVVVFAEGIELDNREFLDDKDCLDKLCKFLIDPKFSIKSIWYMSDNFSNADGVEKYKDQRDRLWSRRESRTPVRVYYMPIHTKYYTVYYVVNIDKDTNHINGGISDSVYKSHVACVDKLLKRINNMSKEEALNYANEAQKDYLLKVKPLTNRRNRKN